jgi:protein-S-isoprenylcysteine O-methyltransferase Ste14
MDSLRYINAVWSLVGIYWVVGMVFAGFLLALTGTAIAVGEVRAFIGLGLAFFGFLLKSAAEEKFMCEEFSAEYARYAQRVRRLIPFVY